MTRFIPELFRLGTLKKAAVVALIVALAGCAGHKHPAPPPPVYPPVPEDSIQILTQLPEVRYAKIGTTTVQEAAATPITKTLVEVRKRAAQMGANTIVIRSEKEFILRNNRRPPVRMRRTVFQLIRR